MVDDHPIVRNLERTGTPDGRDEIDTSCPVCGQYAERYFIQDREIIGCNECIDSVDSTEYLTEQAEEEAWMYG